MGEKLEEKQGGYERDEFDDLTPQQASAVTVRSIAAIAASLDAGLMILERWALRQGIITEKDLGA